MRVIGPRIRFTSCIDLLFQFLDVECGHFTRFKDIELLLEIGVVILTKQWLGQKILLISREVTHG